MSVLVCTICLKSCFSFRENDSRDTHIKKATTNYIFFLSCNICLKMTDLGSHNRCSTWWIMKLTKNRMYTEYTFIISEMQTIFVCRTWSSFYRQFFFWQTRTISIDRCNVISFALCTCFEICYYNKYLWYVTESSLWR